MQNKIGIFIVGLLLMYGCKKVDFGSPQIKTATLSITTPDSFSLQGAKAVCTSSLDVSGTNFTYGFCYSLTRNPVIPGLAKVSQNYSAGSFSALLPNLEYGKMYYLRAFVTNGLVTTYSNQDSFAMPAYISSGNIKNISSRSFETGITVQSIPGGNIDSVGICYSTSKKPTVMNLTRIVAATGSSTLNMQVTDTLKAGTTYYLRSLLISGGQAFYGNELSFKTAGYKGGSGGYVFFDKGDSSGHWQYLEAVPDTVIISNATWGCTGITIPGIIAGIGAGYENSNAIVAGCNLDNTAAKLCRTLAFKNNTDWYLPTIDELKALYQLKLSGIISLTDQFFSSIQASSTDCLVLNFSNGQQQQIAKSATTALVWAVRRF